MAWSLAPRFADLIRHQVFWGGSRGRGRNWTLGPALAYVIQLPELPLSVANVFSECTSLSRLSKACWFPDDVTARPVSLLFPGIGLVFVVAPVSGFYCCCSWLVFVCVAKGVGGGGGRGGERKWGGGRVVVAV